MALFRGMCRSDPQCSAVSAMEAKHTRLGYMTRLSRLHSLDPHIALAFSRSSHSTAPDPEQENNKGTPDKSHIPKADPPTTGLHTSN
jgi:hypothetical protein